MDALLSRGHIGTVTTKEIVLVIRLLDMLVQVRGVILEVEVGVEARS